MNGGLSDSSTFLAVGLRGCDLPAGVGVGDAETIAAITSNSALTFGIIVFMYFTFLVVAWSGIAPFRRLSHDRLEHSV
jgi:hypothetical protein